MVTPGDEIVSDEETGTRRWGDPSTIAWSGNVDEMRAML